MKKLPIVILVLLSITQFNNFSQASPLTKKRWLLADTENLSTQTEESTQQRAPSYTLKIINNNQDPVITKTSTPPPAKQPKRKQKDLWPNIQRAFTFKIPENTRIRAEKFKYLKYKGSLGNTLARAEPYIYTIIAELQHRNMPLELAFLPLLESAFNPKARSTARAEGLWQIIASTAEMYNQSSTRTNWFEPRKDFIESTAIALNLLESLNQQFDGDWLLTLAAYNAGDGRVRKAIKENRGKNLPTHFWALNLPRETMEYVPKMLALIDIVKNNKKYNFSLPQFDSNNRLVKININKQIELKTVSQITGLDLDDLLTYNAGYVRQVTQPTGPHYFMVPANFASIVNESLSKHNYRTEELLDQRNMFGQVYTAQNSDSGVNVSDMNRKYQKVSDTEIQKYTVKKTLSTSNSTAKKKFYKIKRGDTLSSIAKSFKISSNDLRQWNKIKNAKALAIGKMLVIMH